MNIGILKVASVLEEARMRVGLVDLSGVDNYVDTIHYHALRKEFDIFGITATTPQLPSAVEVRNAIKGAVPNAKIILGGPHVTLVNAAFKRECKLGLQGRASKAMDDLVGLFDVLVAGDGEVAVLQAIEPSSPKLIDADDPRSSLFLKNNQLAKVPFPARHLIDVESYHYYIDEERALSLIAQLGCPFGCGFCGGRLSPFLRQVRIRPTENVIEEIRLMHETYGNKGFMLYDDELNVNKEMINLMRSIRKLQDDIGVEFRLRGFIKSELFTDEQAEVMYAAGFRWMLVGFESGSPRILENINKRATREDNTRCMEIARRHGLKVKALMSVGHPGESFDTVMQTHQWLLGVKPDDFDVTIITPYPGTPYYDMAVPRGDGVWVYTYERTGDKLYAREVNYLTEADYYKGDPNDGYVSHVFTDSLSSEQLTDLRGFVEKDVREKLNIPFNTGAPRVSFEHTMGQSGPLPPNIFRRSGEKDTEPRIKAYL